MHTRAHLPSPHHARRTSGPAAALPPAMLIENAPPLSGLPGEMTDIGAHPLALSVSHPTAPDAAENTLKEIGPSGYVLS